MNVRFDKPKGHRGPPLFVAVLPHGKRVECYTRTHVMVLRRLTHRWEDHKGKEVNNDKVYSWLCSEVGYYV